MDGANQVARSSTSSTATSPSSSSASATSTPRTCAKSLSGPTLRGDIPPSSYSSPLPLPLTSTHSTPQLPLSTTSSPKLLLPTEARTPKPPGPPSAGPQDSASSLHECAHLHSDDSMGAAPTSPFHSFPPLKTSTSLGRMPLSARRPSPETPSEDVPFDTS